MVMRLAVDVVEHSTSRLWYLLLFLLADGCFKRNGQFDQVDGCLAPDDHVWSTVRGSKGGREAVLMVGEVHSDLLLGAGMADNELV